MRYRPLLSMLALICFLLAAVVPASAQGLDQLKIDFKLVATGIQNPIAIANAGDGSNRLFVNEKRGRILIIDNGKLLEKPFLDISALVDGGGAERGFLGLAFHPKYKENGFFYVYYNNFLGQVSVHRYQVSSSDPNVADPASDKLILAQDHFADQHNGGQLAFGPDGYLYIGIGDNRDKATSQDLHVLLGKILRIDVDKGDPYTIPADNPFASGGDARPEIWAYGLRNPWRFSFDRTTGDFYIGEVGDNKIEEIDVEAAGSKGGNNYGWSVLEGNRCIVQNKCNSVTYTAPVFTYEHGVDGIAVIGGYVYRGKQFPHLSGTYLFGDYGSGNVWGMQATADGKWETRKLAVTTGPISSFGLDEQGEIYVALISPDLLGPGRIFQVVEAGQ